MKTQAPITPGTTVIVDGDTGGGVGLVEQIQTDITNGAKVATVRLPCGGTTALPINHLRQEAPQ